MKLRKIITLLILTGAIGCAVCICHTRWSQAKMESHLAGNPSNITTITVSPNPLHPNQKPETIEISDDESLKYFSSALALSLHEGYYPSHRRTLHTACVHIDGILWVTIGLYPSRGDRGFTVYYPYYASSQDPQYYWISLTDPVPLPLLKLYRTLCDIDSR